MTGMCDGADMSSLVASARTDATPCKGATAISCEVLTESRKEHAYVMMRWHLGRESFNVLQYYTILYRQAN